MQLDNIEKQRFRNSFHCMKKIIQKRGVRTLFTGWGVTTLKECKYYSSYFFAYEGMKETLRQSDIKYISKASVPLAGASAGFAGWLFSYPFDSVRAGLHGQTLKKGATPTAIEILQDVLKTQGVRGLLTGISPTLTRAALVHSVRFSAYEGILWLVRGFGDNPVEVAEKKSPSIMSFFKRKEENHSAT